MSAVKRIYRVGKGNSTTKKTSRTTVSRMPDGALVSTMPKSAHVKGLKAAGKVLRARKVAEPVG